MTLFGSVPDDSGDVVVLGLPFSHGSARGGGTGMAPSAVRAVSGGENFAEGLWDYSTSTPILRRLGLSDAGDLVHRASMERRHYLQAIEHTVSRIARKSKIPLCLGGDHTVTLPAVLGVIGAVRAIQVVHVDAHHDDSALFDGAQPTHSNFVSFLVCNPAVDRIIQVGIRGYSSIKPNGSAKIYRTTVSGVEAALDASLPTYLTIDSDAFDPGFLPAVRHPVPGGLSLDDLVTLLEGILRSGSRIVGVDWTEYDVELEERNNRSAHFIVFGIVRILQALERQGT